MPGKGFVNGGADDGAAIEGFHVLLDLRRSPFRFGKRHIEERFFGHFLVCAGRIHGREGQGARERRSLLNDRHYLRGNGDDMMLLDKAAESAQHIAKGLRSFPAGG